MANGGAKKAPTIKDVAALAGVAPGTVSNVLTGKKLVAEPLRKSVLDAISTLDYRPNHLASSLRFGRTKTIGIVVPDMTNPFFSGLVKELELRALNSGFQTLLMSSHEDVTEEKERIKALIARQVDGLIISSSGDWIDPSPNSTINGVPTVLVDRAFTVDGFDTVSADNEQAALMGAQHLIDFGHRRITFLATAPELGNIVERVSGYRKAMEAAGLGEVNVVYGGLTIESCRAAIEQELRREDRPTAIFASAYIATLGAAKAIRAVDLAFPNDVSLLGFDDSDWMTVLRPYVSTIEQPLGELSEACWEMLQRRMKRRDSPMAHKRVTCALRARESTRRLSGRSVRRPVQE
jgi:LacI family transcriptional regulator